MAKPAKVKAGQGRGNESKDPVEAAGLVSSGAGQDQVVPCTQMGTPRCPRCQPRTAIRFSVNHKITLDLRRYPLKYIGM